MILKNNTNHYIIYLNNRKLGCFKPFFGIFKTCFGDLSFVLVYLCREEVLQVEHGRHADHETNPQQDHVHDPELGKKKHGKLTIILINKQNKNRFNLTFFCVSCCKS